jgi:hypothetical protein
LNTDTEAKLEALMAKIVRLLDELWTQHGLPVPYTTLSSQFVSRAKPLGVDVGELVDLIAARGLIVRVLNKRGKAFYVLGSLWSSWTEADKLILYSRIEDKHKRRDASSVSVAKRRQIAKERRMAESQPNASRGAVVRGKSIEELARRAVNG